MKKLIQCAAAGISAVVMVLMGITSVYAQKLPDSFYVVEGNALSVNTLIPIETADPAGEKTVAEASLPSGSGKNIQLKLFGMIPIKTTRVEVVDEKMIIPCGSPFGIKMFTQGVMVVGINDISAAEGMLCPAKKAGMELGDVIISLDGVKVTSNEDIAARISACEGNPVKVVLQRDGEEKSVSVQPVKAKDGIYKIGIWVRDSSAGIGTLTYYDPETGGFGGLGHAVCDIDTGEIMPLQSGEIVNVTIHGVNKGKAGAPGELKGSFSTNRSVGTVLANSETGVFGRLYQAPDDMEPIPIAMKQQIKEGPAVIYTTISGNQCKAYDVEIEKIELNKDAATKNMVIKVTDKELLEATGGIVQGMSGSPIVQDGMMVGAVTHVFVNDPQKGYGIFAENMYTVSQSLLTQDMRKVS